MKILIYFRFLYLLLNTFHLNDKAIMRILILYLDYIDNKTVTTTIVTSV